MGNMLHTESVIGIFFVLGRLDVNSALGIFSTTTINQYVSLD